jgi:polysaccharide export outer membrane protein
MLLHSKYLKFLYFSLILMLVACIPQKNLIYLQPEENQKPIAINEVFKKPYRLTIDDVLNINIKTSDPLVSSLFSKQGDTENQGGLSESGLYLNGYKVDNDGNIYIPVLEKINVLNKTIEEARQIIEKKLLAEHLTKDANLFVDLKLAGIRYTINGEIGSPGLNVIYNDKATIMDAIAQSGDIKLEGNRKEVMIYRQFPHGTETATIDLTKMSAMSSPFYYIQPNDFIYVKPLKQKSFGIGTNGFQTFTTLITTFTLILTTILIIAR